MNVSTVIQGRLIFNLVGLITEPSVKRPKSSRKAAVAIDFSREDPDKQTYPKET